MHVKYAPILVKRLNKYYNNLIEFKTTLNSLKLRILYWRVAANVFEGVEEAIDAPGWRRRKSRTGNAKKTHCFLFPLERRQIKNIYLISV